MFACLQKFSVRVQLSYYGEIMFLLNYSGCLFALYVVYMCCYGMCDKCVYELSDTIINATLNVHIYMCADVNGFNDKLYFYYQ